MKQLLLILVVLATVFASCSKTVYMVDKDKVWRVTKKRGAYHYYPMKTVKYDHPGKANGHHKH